MPAVCAQAVAAQWFQVTLLLVMLQTWLLQMEAKSKQNSQAKDRQKGVPFYPPGYLHYPTDLLRSRFSRAECLAELEQELAAAWPQAFLQVTPLPHHTLRLFFTLLAAYC